MNMENGMVPVMMQPFHLDGSLDWDGLSELIDFYIESGATALFATCGSTEISHLTPEEVVDVVQKTIALAAGRVPVIAGAIRDGIAVGQQADFVKRIADLGADAVAITAAMMVPESADETAFLKAVGELLGLSGDIPLGIYEAPTPYHRRMPAETLGKLAQTGRFVFHKDTSCDAAQISAKLQAVEGTLLRFFNAHSPTLLHSLCEGGAGYSGVGTNFYPEIYAELCRCFKRDPARAEAIQAFLDAEEPLLANDCYPQTAKMFLQSRGVNITSRIRQDRAITFDKAADLIVAKKLYNDFK